MDAHKQEVINTLKEFGFEDNAIEFGYNNAPIKTVEGIVDFLEKNPVPPPGTAQQQPPAETAAPNQPFVQNISHLVKPEIVAELITQGHSKIVSEKAVLMSGNKDIESAIAWINENKSKSDFEEPIQVEIPEKKVVDPEQARIQALELQKKIRAEIMEKERLSAIESEKLRVKMAKEMVETKRIMDEQKQKQAMEEYMREKAKTEQEKAEMIRKLEEDKIARFGKLPVHVEKPKTIKEKFDELYGKLYKAHRLGGIETLKGCLGMVKLYIDNVIKNPTEEKFRKINGSNQKFVERVKDVAGGLPLLSLIGFAEENGFFVLHNPNIEELKEISGFLEHEMSKLG